MKLIIIAFFSIIFCISTAYGSNDTTHTKTLKNTAYINPLSLAVRTLNFSYERFLNQRFSVRIAGLSGKILPAGKGLENERNFKFSGGTLEIRNYRRVYSERTTEDFYLGPYLQCFKNEITDYKFLPDSGFERDSIGRLISVNSDLTVYKPGFLAGARQVYFRRLVADIHAGIHYQIPDKNLPVGTEVIRLMTRQGLGFRIGFNIGFAF